MLCRHYCFKAHLVIYYYQCIESNLRYMKKKHTHTHTHIAQQNENESFCIVYEIISSESFNGVTKLKSYEKQKTSRRDCSQWQACLTLRGRVWTRVTFHFRCALWHFLLRKDDNLIYKSSLHDERSFID